MRKLLVLLSIAVVFTSCNLFSTLATTDFPIYNIAQNYVLNSGYYLVNGNIIIQEEVTLTIQPNVKLIFDKDCGIVCFGNIQAVGTKAEPIYFTSKEDRWNNISIIDSSDENCFSYCYFTNGSGIPENSKYVTDMYKTGVDTVPRIAGAVYCKDTFGISFDHCVFQECEANSPGALSCLNTQIEITNCAFLNNKSKYAIGAIEIRDSDFEISSCKLKQNSANFCGAIGIYSSEGTIQNCSINDNHSHKRSAAIVLSDSDVVLSGCKITNNKFFGGILIKNYETEYKTIIDNCIISNNHSKSEGGGINCAGEIILRNCRIMNNVSELLGGGCAFIEHGPVKVIDSIITGNYSKRNGGGLYYTFIKDISLIERCSIVENKCDINGGGISSFGSNLKVIDSTIGKNRALKNGGGVHLQNTGSKTKENLYSNVNSIINDNLPDNIFQEN